MARLELPSRISQAKKAVYAPGYRVRVQGSANQLRFAERVGAFGDKASALAQMTTARGTSYGGLSHFQFAPSRSVLADYATVLHADDLQAIATSDVYWDEVRSIESDGEEDVYDMTVAE